MHAATDPCEQISCLSLYGREVSHHGEVDRIVGGRHSLRSALLFERETALSLLLLFSRARVAVFALAAVAAFEGTFRGAFLSRW